VHDTRQHNPSVPPPERKSRVEPVPADQLDDDGRRAIEEWVTPRTGRGGEIIYPGDDATGADDDD
jgi:hypothetical protein